MSVKLIDELFNKLKSIHLDKALNENKHKLFFEKPVVSSIHKDELYACYTLLKNALNERYGIIGGGIGLLSVTSNKTRLLFGRKLRKELLDKDIDNTEIFDFPYPNFKTNKELINLSFFASREVDEPAEYVRIINEPTSLGSEIENIEFLNKNHFLWIKAEEIIKQLKDYDELLAHIIKNEKITNTHSLVNNYKLSNDLPVSILIEKIRKSNGQLKKELFASGDTYITKIKAISTSETITTAEAINRISNLYNQAPFPLLSYSLIYQLTTTTNPKYSHIVFPIWNTYSDINAYKYLGKDNLIKNEYSLVHGLYTIDENKLNHLDEELLVEYKLVLRQMIEPIIDREHYEKIKARDIDIQIAHLKSSTIAVIMSRNLSHTDGSHVMVDFENSFNEKLSKNLNEDPRAFLSEQFKLYNEHLRNTMELVADVSGKIGVQSNYEYCLKDFIGGLSEKYFSKINRADKTITEGFLGTGLNDGKAHSVIKGIREKKLALFPGGENGKTAFISILKNIFRNLKKHSSPLEFQTTDRGKRNIYKVDIEVNEIEVNDDDESSNKDKSLLKEEYYQISVIERSCEYTESQINKDIKKINKHLIEESIVDSSGKVKKNGWGLLEMRICAAYLIGLPLDEFKYNTKDDIFRTSLRTYPMRFIEVVKVKSNNNGKYNLSHIFYLRKPKFATIWLKTENEIPKGKWNDFEALDFIIKVRNIDEKGTLQNIDFSNPSEFVIGKPKYGEISKHYNFRVISSELISEYKNPEAIKNKIKQIWTNSLAKSVSVLIHHDQESSATTSCFSADPDCKDLIKLSEYTEKFKNKEAGIIDDHCEYFNSLLVSEGGTAEAIKYIMKTYGYYEKSTTNNSYNKDLRKAEDYVKIETINTKVCIWDERIKESLETTVADDNFNTDDLYQSSVFEMKGITLPYDKKNTKIDLHQYFYSDNKGEYKASTLTQLIADLKRHLTFANYIILHFSGFENIVGRTRKYDECKFPITEAYKDLLEGLELKNEKMKSKYLIFTSGKGIPTTLPESCYFIPYTTLKTLVETKPKINLVSTLNSLRIIKNNQL